MCYVNKWVMCVGYMVYDVCGALCVHCTCDVLCVGHVWSGMFMVYVVYDVGDVWCRMCIYVMCVVFVMW